MQQTTKGVHIDVNPEKNVLIFDIEGSDSRERDEEGENIERKFCLFALAMSDILLINIPFGDIGRRNSSHNILL